MTSRPPGSLQPVTPREVRIAWSSLREIFAEHADAGIAGWIRETEPHFRHQHEHALSRLDAGIDLLTYCELAESLPERRVDVLDIGAGNGGVALAFANCSRYRVHAIDLAPNTVLYAVKRATAIPLNHAVGTGHALPYADASFDIALLIDTIEHVSNPRRLGAEIMRVLRPGGFCMVSTVARLRFFFRRDPHFGIRGLVMLPNSLQRFVVNRIARRRNMGHGGCHSPAYDVEHIFWNRQEIGRLFPGAAEVAALYSWPVDPNAKPPTKEWLRWHLRDYVFDHVRIRKG